MFLAAQLAYNLGFDKVNIITIDTDVAILGIYYQSILNGTIFPQYGTSTKVSSKVKVMKTVKKDEDFLIAASLLCENESVSTTVRETLERMVCLLYKTKQEVDVNDARYKLFTQSRKIPSSQSLPPTKDALYLHFERKTINANSGKKALEQSHTLPDPTT